MSKAVASRVGYVPVQLNNMESENTSTQEHPPSSSSDSREVYLREGNLVLRWLFGYYDKRTLPEQTVPLRWPTTMFEAIARTPLPPVPLTIAEKAAMGRKTVRQAAAAKLGVPSYRWDWKLRRLVEEDPTGPKTSL